MKLTNLMKSYGFDLVESPDPARNNPKLKVYTDSNVYIGFQKIGNVFRIDVQQVYMGIFPMGKSVDNLIVPKEELERVATEIMEQLSNPRSEMPSEEELVTPL